MPNLYFYTLVLGFVSGIGTRSFLPLHLFEILCVFLVSFAFAYVWRMRREVFRSPLFIASLFLCAYGLGMLRLESVESYQSPLTEYMNTFIVFEGMVVREPDVREKSVHLYVRDAITEELVLVRTNPFLSITYGDRVSVSGELVQPEAFMTDTGRTFDYPGYLKARGVQFVLESNRVSVLNGGNGNIFIDHLLKIKRAFIDALERVIPEPAVSLGEGITLGVKRALGDELEGVFRDVGLTHIVVLSGYNIMVVAEYLMLALAYAFRPHTRMFLGVAGITIFALLVGPSATVVRASLMAALVLIARGTGRTYAILRALMLAAMMMLVLNPYLLVYDPGFQLSFLATLGLILFAPVCMRWFVRVPATWGIRDVLSATIATQLCVLPLLLYSMGTFSLVSILANILVLPVIPLAMVLVFLSGTFGLMSDTLGFIPGYFGYGVLSYVIYVAQILASLPFASFSVPTFPFVIVVLLYGALSMLFIATRVTTDDEVVCDKEVRNANDLALDEWKIDDEDEGTLRTATNNATFPFR